MLPVHLASTAHHEQVARCRRNVDRSATTLRAQEEGPLRTEGDDRDASIAELAQLAVGVPGDAVIAVAVVVAANRAQRYAETAFEAGGQQRKRGVRTARVVRIPAGQARVVEHPV